MNRFRYLAFIILSVIACTDKKDNGEENVISKTDEDSEFALRSFRAISNFKEDDSALVGLNLDYHDALESGFVVPSVRQSANGYFVFSFEIKNMGNEASTYKYKIYYQNETYKFEEANANNNSENPLAAENFYGSWNDSTLRFKSTTLIANDGAFHTVTDSFNIVGNPRFELRYYDNGINQRWKRNPRVGIYSFLLVAYKESSSPKNIIPDYIANISATRNNEFVNPYYYYLFGEGSQMKDLIVLKSDINLKIVAKPDSRNGIYIQPGNFQQEQFKSSFNDFCNQEKSTYQQAAFEQFINNQDPSMRFDNIPVVRDIMAKDYTYKDYNWDLAFYKSDETISTLPGVARRPCETVEIDNSKGKIILKNPGCKEGEWRKESVGIRTRHGLTYGKYRLKCKLTELLNENNVWNGITNAIWLLNQQNGGAWNFRRECKNTGFMATYWGGSDDKRVPYIDYSEIDFEILKTPPYCPSVNFPPVIRIPSPNKKVKSSWDMEYSEDLRGTEPLITVACTNWDMACWDPKNFNSGCNEIPYRDQVFASHRWTKDYRAITQKKYEPDDELFGTDYYYFEIDWRPTEIIWRIGKSVDNMRVVGYMNDEVTVIPNNQMTLIITQEYHNTKWWPGSPFIQENIPFPSKDLIGEIYELVIE